jgi:hypothetical protein
MMELARPEHSYESQGDEHRGRSFERETAPHSDFSNHVERNEKYAEDVIVTSRYEGLTNSIDLTPDGGSEYRPVLDSLIPPLTAQSAPPGTAEAEPHESLALAVLTSNVQPAARAATELTIAPSRSTGFVAIAPIAVTFSPGPVAGTATIIIAPVSSIVSYTIVSIVSANPFERRYENILPAYVSYARDAAGSAYARAPAGAVLAGTIDTGAAKAAEPGMLQRLGASLALVSSSFVSTDWTSHITGATTDADDRDVEAPVEKRQPAEATSEEEALLGLDSADLARQKRKASAVDATDRPSLSPQLQRLAELPAIRDALSLLHQLWQATDEAIVSLVAVEQPGTATLPDDGMVELLAMDVVGARRTMAPAVEPVAVAAQSVALQAEIGLYQAFEVESGAAELAASASASPNAASQVAQAAPERQTPAE